MIFKLTALLMFAPPLVLAVTSQPGQSQVSSLLTQFGLTADQRTAIDQGRPAAKVLSWGGPSEVYVFGAVFIDAAPAAYLKAARNVGRLGKSPGYLGIGELPATATAADVAGLSLDPDDLKALKNCKEGDCDIQLPTSSIKAFRETVDWTQADPSKQVNDLARGMILDLLREYRRGGNAELGVYRDKEHPARVADQFEMMVSRSATLPELLPELRQYLLRYPEATLPGADSFFYWEKVDFGMKPTIRVNHSVIYHAGDGTGDISVVAIKQLYASHYFHTALDVSVCVVDTTKPERRGFYLMTLKSSEQDGLTGVKGSMLRKIVVDKTRGSMETGLAAIKKSLETPAAASER
jgi:hypothetical protein